VGGEPAGKSARSTAKNYGAGAPEQSAGADPSAHTNPFILEGSVDAGLGIGVKGSIPLIAGEVEVFFGNSALFDVFGDPRVEMAARALVRVNIVGFETVAGFELVESERPFPEAGIDARFSRRLREEGLGFFNPFTNGFRSDAQIPQRLGIQPKLVLGLGGSLGVGVDLEVR
jgi:hypothetical protein